MIMSQNDIGPSPYLEKPIRTLEQATLDRLRNGSLDEYAVLREYDGDIGRAWVEMEPGMTRADIVRWVAEGQFGRPDQILLVRRLSDRQYWDVTDKIKEEAGVE